MSSKSPFIGRKNEIDEILIDLKSNKGTKLLLVGESGVGKSALLDEVHRRLTEDEDLRNRVFVGYYSKKESLIAESESLIYPFSIVLESLIDDVKESQQLGEKIDSAMGRVKRGFLKSGKEQGIKIAVAVLDDIANKVGLKETLEIVKGIAKAVGSEKTSLMLGQQYINDHRDEATQSYLDIFRAIADEFKDRRFVLIFDQFESVGKASTDFFLNFVKFLEPKERFDIIVSFKTDDTIWNDVAARKVYEDLERTLTYDLRAKKISIEGLSAEDIGKWIKQVRKILLPANPDLQRIREKSAGLPLVLEEWIRTSENLNDYEKIKRHELCNQTIKLEERLDEQDQIKLYRLSILLQPLKHKSLASYLEMGDNIELVRPFIKRLIQHRIFDEHFRWFRHELVQKCFEDDLVEEEKTSYHKRAAEFFASLQIQKKRADEADKQESYSISISRAYHFHMAGDHEKSLAYNKELAEYAFKIGDLDVAERCYRKAIDDAKNLGRPKDEMDCMFHMTQNVYDTWARYNESMSNYQHLLEYYDSVNNILMEAAVLNNIAIIYDVRGKSDLAIEIYNKNLKLMKELGNQRGIATTLNNIALIHDNKGKYDKAMKKYNQSLEISKQLGEQEEIARTLNNIAAIHLKKGEYDQSIELYNQSLEISEKIGDQSLIAQSLSNMALIHYIKKEYDQSMELYNQSLKISEQIGHQRGIGMTLNNIGLIHDSKGEYDKAMKKYNQSLEILEQIGDEREIANTLNNIALIHYNKEEYEQAARYLFQASAILKRLESPKLERSGELLASIKNKLGNEAFERLVEKVESQDSS